MNPLQERYHLICEDVKNHLDRLGRFSDSVRLLVISKTQSVSNIRAIYELGQREFGENYVQELLAKAKETQDLAIRWVYVGALQSNKIKQLVQVASEVQTVTSDKHLRYLARYAAECGKTPYPIYISVNYGSEETKQGASLAALDELVRVAVSLPELSLEGLMAIPPAPASYSSHELMLADYKKLAELAKNVGKGKLSLGMSGDLAEALTVGSTTIRLGTAIFGPRA